MIVIYGTLVQNDCISMCLYFLRNFNFPGCWGVKWQKIVQNEEKFCLSCSMSWGPYII